MAHPASACRVLDRGGNNKWEAARPSDSLRRRSPAPPTAGDSDLKGSVPGARYASGFAPAPRGRWGGIDNPPGAELWYVAAQWADRCLAVSRKADRYSPRLPVSGSFAVHASQSQGHCPGQGDANGSGRCRVVKLERTVESGRGFSGTRCRHPPPIPRRHIPPESRQRVYRRTGA